MREILFRGKRVDNGEWIEGFLIETGSVDFGIIPILSQSVIDKLNTEFYPEYEINPDTLSQYTGLKDKNGNMIFENDIVKAPYFLESEPRSYLVEYQDLIGYGIGFVLTRFGYELPTDEWDECEVIGNKFDNPELIKGNSNANRNV